MSIKTKKMTITFDIWDIDYEMAKGFAQGKDVEEFIVKMVEENIRDWGDRMETREIKDSLIEDGLY